MTTLSPDRVKAEGEQLTKRLLAIIEIGEYELTEDIKETCVAALDAVSKPDKLRRDLALLLTMGFKHKMDNGDHVVTGFGREYRHTDLQCIGLRIARDFLRPVSAPKEGELLPCPFCGHKPYEGSDYAECRTAGCAIAGEGITKSFWQARAPVPQATHAGSTGPQSGPHDDLLKQARDALVQCRIKYWCINDEPEADEAISKLEAAIAKTERETT